MSYKLNMLQKDYFDNGQYNLCIQVTKSEEMLKLLNFFSEQGVRDRQVWEYAYAHDKGGYKAYLPLLEHFNENVRISVRTNKEGLVKVYRGINRASSPLGSAYSWTTNKNVAIEFANLHNVYYDGKIYEGYVEKQHILSQIKIRNEAELIILPQHIKIVKFYDLYPVITDKELDLFGAKFGNSSIRAFLLHGFIKDYTKSYKDYEVFISKLDETERKLLDYYGDFYSFSDTDMSKFLRSNFTNGVFGYRYDKNLIQALREVAILLRTGISKHNTTAFNRYKRTIIEGKKV